MCVYVYVPVCVSDIDPGVSSTYEQNTTLLTFQLELDPFADLAVLHYSVGRLAVHPVKDVLHVCVQVWTNEWYYIGLMYMCVLYTPPSFKCFCILSGL